MRQRDMGYEGATVWIQYSEKTRERERERERLRERQTDRTREREMMMGQNEPFILNASHILGWTFVDTAGSIKSRG